MSQLAVVALIVGGATIALSAPALLLPDSTRKWCRLFPRSAPAAWALTAMDLAWAAALLYGSPILADIQWARRLSVVLAPVAFLLIVFLLDELLAARALGGLLVLVPRPMLDAAFMSDSEWTLAITLLAYVLAIAGIVLILSPFRFRRCAEFLLKTDARGRLAGAIGILAGTAIVILALTVY